jgi:inhibitor of cysteine peptidase
MRCGPGILLVALACATPPPPAPPAAVAPTRITLPESGGRAVLAVGQELALTLEANASTGYRWEVVAPVPDVVSVVDPGTYREAPDPDARVGTGGTTSFVFRAIHPGTGVLTLVYRRAWETGVAPARTTRVEIEVLSASAAALARPPPEIAARSEACPRSSSTPCWPPVSSSPPE